MTASYRTLISAAELAPHIDRADCVVFDCRFDLSDPARGRQAWLRGHLPHAFHLDLNADLSSTPNGRNGRHPLPDPVQLAARLESCGVSRDSQVVAYDEAGSGSMFAARLWWLLRWLGHERVAVLDGGIEAWRDGGLPLSTELPVTRAASLEWSLGEVRLDADDLLARLGQPGLLLLDARSPDRFRGENEVLDPVGGHIPGAANRFFFDNLDADGRFKPPAALRAEFDTLLGSPPASEIVHQCGSGVSACVNLLAMEVAGLPGSKLYAGSWSEWCANPARPVATGAA